MTSEDWMRGNGFRLNFAQAKAELANHGYKRVSDRSAKDTPSIIIHDGDGPGEDVELPLNSKAILEWLGY